MKDRILLELAAKWEREATATGPADGSPEAQRANDIDAGRRAGKRECATALLTLIEILGESPCANLSEGWSENDQAIPVHANS